MGGGKGRVPTWTTINVWVAGRALRTYAVGLVPVGFAHGALRARVGGEARVLTARIQTLVNFKTVDVYLALTGRAGGS